METVDATTDTRSSVDRVKRRGVTGKLVTVGHLADMLSCSRQTALKVSQHWSFPVPLDVLWPDGDRPMALWWRKDVERWVTENPDAVNAKAQERARRKT